jgi:Zn-dependent protease with chaperone function
MYGRWRVKILLILAALLGCTLPASANSSVADMLHDYDVARAAFGELAPNVRVRVIACDEVNAAFEPADNTVYLCSELAPLGDDVITFVAAHELAHALVWQLGIDDVDPEAGADELASLLLEEDGHRAAVVAAAEMFMGLHKDPSPNDVHPANMVRARDLLCIDDGEDGPNAADPNCALYTQRARSSWVRVILTALRAMD